MKRGSAMGSDSETGTLWRAAAALNARAGATHLPPLLFFTDPDRTPEPWRVAARLPAGAGVVHRGFGRPEAADEATRLRDVCGARGLRLLIGADPALAERVGADGVHWPERLAAEAAAWRARRIDWLMTAAWHPGGGAAPPSDSLDALVISPVFTPGGVSTGTPLGLKGLKAAVARAVRPVYALGGIDAGNAGALADSGVCGLAGVNGIVGAEAAPIRI